MRLLTSGERWTDRTTPARDALAEIDAVVRPADQAALVVDTFYGVGSRPVSAERFMAVATAVAAPDASALDALGYSYAPFHCPDCAASYCGRHWAPRRFDDGEFHGIEGHCPQGHFHVLQY